MFQPDELAQLDDFFESEVGFRRSEYPQLLGSAHLVVPNPYFRTLHELLDDEVGPLNESIDVHVDARNGVLLPPMKINIVGHRPVGISRSVDVPLTSTPTKVPMGPAIRMISATVRLAGDDSVLQVCEPAPFMREIHMAMDMQSSKRTVNVADSTGTVVETYDVSVGVPYVSHMGKRPPSAAADSLEAMLNETRVRVSAKELEQQWFAGSAVEARGFVRTLISRAREQVLIADPYFSGLEVQRYALATTVAHVAVRMLTTRDGFSSGAMTSMILDKNLARWQVEDPTLGKLEMRVLDRNELHDRFLRIDDRIYSLGNSLNSIGDKASLLIRVPDPTPVILELEKLWKDATPLEDLIRAPGAGGST